MPLLLTITFLHKIYTVRFKKKSLKQIEHCLCHSKNNTQEELENCLTVWSMSHVVLQNGTRYNDKQQEPITCLMS